MLEIKVIQGIHTIGNRDISAISIPSSIREILVDFLDSHDIEFRYFIRLGRDVTNVIYNNASTSKLTRQDLLYLIEFLRKKGVSFEQSTRIYNFLVDIHGLFIEKEEEESTWYDSISLQGVSCWVGNKEEDLGNYSE